MGSNEKIKDRISANIAFYRKQIKLTQKDLAYLLGVKTTTISTWERAASLPDAETLFELCKIFRISLSDMYGNDTIEFKESFPVSDMEKEIILKYRKSDAITKELVHRSLGIDPNTNKMGKIS